MSPAVPSLAQPDGQPVSRAPILAVDDQPANLVALEAILADLGHDLVKAASGEDALRWLLDNDPAVILLDVRMPGLDGYETARLIRGRDRSRHTPIIFVTAHETPPGKVVQAFREGAADFLVKPLVPDVLRAKVTRYVELYLKAEGDRRKERQEFEQRLAERALEDQKRAEETLKEADRRKDEFLAMLAHELRNPLAPICNALQTLGMPAATTADVEAARAVMGRQVVHLTRLVDDFLDVSRLLRGKIQLRKELVGLGQVIARTAEAARPLLDARRQEFTIVLPPEPVLLEADVTRLTQVLVNLLDNAAKYMEEGGRVWLTAQLEGMGSRPPGEVLLRVRDTGMGIRADLLPHIFDLFSQGERSLDRSQGGLGLGLTLVRRLVEMHGGSVQAFSDGPGRGSEFVVRLPLSAVAAPPGGTPALPVRPRPIHRALRVLIVDDNIDAAISLGIVLRLWGHDVEVAHDGAKALDETEGRVFDVVVLDIGLPGLDGYELARHLRRRPGWEKTFLIAMTGYGQEEDRRRAREAGFDLHLVKPVDPATLEKLLRERAGPADPGGEAEPVL